ncbi:MAG: hypothetical protein M1351_02695 [Candidatus Thermoplasmatota archaeon]|nr:hypothetical protein [Candidatus Thermoplasmatota archaeon]
MVNAMMMAGDECSTWKMQTRSFFLSSFVLFLTALGHVETLKGIREISRSALLRLKAPVISMEGMIAMAYIAEKIVPR